MRACVCVRMRARVCACMHVCVCLCLGVRMGVCVCVCVRVHAHMCVFVRACACVNVEEINMENTCERTRFRKSGLTQGMVSLQSGPASGVPLYLTHTYIASRLTQTMPGC